MFDAAETWQGLATVKSFTTSCNLYCLVPVFINSGEAFIFQIMKTDKTLKFDYQIDWYAIC